MGCQGSKNTAGIKPSKSLASLYKLDITPNQERSVKIEKLWLFPMRGILGIEVDHIKVSKYGIKYDR